MISNNLGKRLVLATLALALGIVGYLLINNFLKATLTITVDPEAAVAVFKLDDNKTRIWSDTGKASFSVKLPKGNYVVQVSKNFDATKQVTSLGWRAKKSISLDLKPSLGSIKVFESGTTSIFEKDDQLLQLDSATSNLLSPGPNLAVDAQGRSLDRVVYSEKSRVGVGLSPYGELLFLNSSGNIQAMASAIGVAIDYDRVRDQFCVLLQNKKLVFINTMGQITVSRNLDGAATNISCSNGSVAYANISPIFDNGAKDQLLETTLHFISANDKKSSLKAGEVTALELSDDGSVIYFAGEKTVWRLDTTTNSKIRLLDVLSINRSSLIFGDKRLLVFDNAEVWDVNTETGMAVRLLSGNKFSALTANYITLAGQTVFSIGVGLETGTFIASSDKNLVATFNKASLSLPYSTADFSINISFDGSRVILDVVVTAAIPSSGDLGNFNHAKTNAVEFVNGLGLDSTYYRLRFSD